MKMTTLRLRGRTFVIGVPFMFLLVFFMVPFLAVLAISFAEPRMGVPPYTPIADWQDGALHLQQADLAIKQGHTQEAAQALNALNLNQHLTPMQKQQVAELRAKMQMPTAAAPAPGKDVKTLLAAGRDALVQWLMIDYIPTVLGRRDCPAMMALVFAATPPLRPKDGVDWYGRRLTILWFIEAGPDLVWNDIFAGQDEAVAASGLGRVELCAPFIPVVPGTDTYVDELR